VEQASAALRQASVFTRKSHEQWRQAGEAFSEAKAKVGYGKWDEMLKAYNLDSRKVQMAMKISRNWGCIVENPNYSPDLSATELTTLLVSHAQEDAEEGQAKEEIAEHPKVQSQFCSRCQRVGPTKDCEACQELAKGRKPKPPDREPADDTDQIAADKKAASAQLKNGSPDFDWNAFVNHFGGLIRDIDTVGKNFGCKDCPQADALRLALVAWKEQFKQFYAENSKKKPPSIQGL
jgi:hypothetical protein